MGDLLLAFELCAQGICGNMGFGEILLKVDVLALHVLDAGLCLEDQVVLLLTNGEQAVYRTALGRNDVLPLLSG